VDGADDPNGFARGGVDLIGAGLLVIFLLRRRRSSLAR
jgi:hypothetical protein